MHIRTLSFCLAAVASLSLTGCGFHLLEPYPAGKTLTVQIVNQSAPLISNSLTQELQLREINTHGQSPDVELMLRGERVDNRLLAIDSELRAAEYQLEHTVEVSAKKGDKRGDWLVFTAIRDYTYDESNVLGKSQEQLLIRQTLREELAQRIVERYLYPVQVALLASPAVKVTPESQN